MPVGSLYCADENPAPHRGAVYQYRPVPWLEPPLWLVRDVHWSPPRRATIFQTGEVRDAFRRADQEHQEDVMTRAKQRFVVVLSADPELGKRNLKEVMVAPAYTFHETHPPTFVEAVRMSRLPYTFYLPDDPSHPEIAECYLDFRQVQPLHREFLTDGKLNVCLAPTTVKAVLQRFRQYLRV
ncbi:MAG: hypothetical protein GX620_16295 [Chloroflexi bacterium]|nr:hypothetical protein [Chloroflexota bacterium]